MKRKINLRLFCIGMFSLVLTATLIIFAFYTAFDKQIKHDIRSTTDTIAATYPYLQTPQELAQLCASDTRITLVSHTGEILFESEPLDGKKMENHLTRPEIQAAIHNHFGEITRKSKTFGYNTYYCATKLKDGNILRVAKTVGNMYAIYTKVLPAIGVIIVFIILLSYIFSSILTDKIIKPIEAMARNLDEIEKHVPYKELENSAQVIKLQQLRRNENERLRQEFTANVSHELKTPLTSISGYAEMIKNGMARKEDIKGFGEKIYNEAARLINLVSDIIKLGELEEMQKAISSFSKVDMRPIVEETVDSLSMTAKQQNITFQTDIHPCTIWGNASMLEELVYNLCDNAIRYNKPNGHVRIFLGEKNILSGSEEPILIEDNLNKNDTTEEADGIICSVLSVEDTGIGIATEYQERIFERFYRVDKSRSKETGGTGLGLSIVKHVAFCHKAKIHIHSHPGQGTKIDIIFP